MTYEIRETEVINKQVEILPCPFCGSDNLEPIHYNGTYGYTSSEDYVLCKSCGATGAHIKNDDGINNTELAISKWNNRVIISDTDDI